MRISDFQKMMKEIYYRRDKERGVEKTFMWLVEEVGELGRAILKGENDQIEEEVADVLAWLASLCNLLGVDLEKAALKKYTGYCPYCKSKPCTCSSGCRK